MFQPIFVVEDPGFAPVPAHEGDAGADIKAFIRDGFNHAQAEKFFDDFEQDRRKYGYNLYVNGVKAPEDLVRHEFVEVIQEAKGAVYLPPGVTQVVDSGFKVMLPDFHKAGYPWNMFVPMYKIVPRSGLAINHGIDVTNSPGIIDSGYRGVVKVSITNKIGVGLMGDNYHCFTHGARIAQGVCEIALDQSKARVTTDQSVIGDTGRGEGGFGSTGV